MSENSNNIIDGMMDGNLFAWPTIPFPAFVTAAGTVVLTCLVIVIARYFDHTGGLLTVSILIISAFIGTTFVSLVYTVPQVPITEILVGALATSLGAIITYWMRRHDRDRGD